MKVIFISESRWQGQLLEMAFEKSGHQLISAYSAQDALIILDSNFYPDVIVTDYFLPDSDAIKLMSILSAYNDTVNIPIVFYTFIPELDAMLKGGFKKSYGIKDVIYAPSTSVDNLISRLEKIELSLN